MSEFNRDLSKKILNFLKEQGRAKKQAGKASTEQIAEACDVSVKDAYSRLWWMEAKDRTLESIGRGKARTWRVAKKARPRKPGASNQAVTSEAVTES